MSTPPKDLLLIDLPLSTHWLKNNRVQPETENFWRESAASLFGTWHTIVLSAFYFSISSLKGQRSPPNKHPGLFTAVRISLSPCVPLPSSLHRGQKYMPTLIPLLPPNSLSPLASNCQAIIFQHTAFSSALYNSCASDLAALYVSIGKTHTSHQPDTHLNSTFIFLFFFFLLSSRLQLSLSFLLRFLTFGSLNLRDLQVMLCARATGSTASLDLSVPLIARLYSNITSM